MFTEQFKYTRIPAEAEAVRSEVREFLRDNLRDFPASKRADSWMGFDAEFSRKLGQRGWIGLSLPTEYGGADAGAFTRYVIVEELLAAGAPVSAHWFSDRQSGQQILRFGTEYQKEHHLPAICRGESFFCIGMSEPNSGSDLASIKTKATPTDNGWILNGQKVWTTNAHRSHYMIALVRTSDSESRHGGMSQFIVDLSLPGITVLPIKDLTGSEHFNEVFFDDVHLDSHALLGAEGDGWKQVTSELSMERSGPERFLSSMALLNTLIDAIGTEPNALQAKEIGHLAARLITLRQMSLTVTEQLAAGEQPAVAAACVKDLGAVFEQDLPELAQLLCDIPPASSGGCDHAMVLAHLTQQAPSFSLRGGTREVLRGIIAKGLGLR
ncbi:acyl-CoA dehydrogenase [Pseudomaricurvus alkylphenolicus]|uniref:acyl-CoA dehydrogenase family protein n=1 Tax=Pseudomaricurvus alkylphenolicus TaxID=1306991 RepID=UPI00141F1D3A|nr:acyl-CoA dehydrogenase family protein [Pseudomaricurvus alkylphenolicus]NIB44092.1 acyl-CoA dehydrogenase [Pseudomaricurvus alkylphenolicus]